MDEWDDLDLYTANESADSASTREIVPEGTHEFRIKSVADTPERLEMMLVHDDSRYFWVKCNPPKTTQVFRKLAGSLAKALGMTGGQLRDAIAAGDITGRRVAARIWHKQGDRGGTFANVGEFHAIEKPEPEAVEPPPAKPARTATKKADAVGHDPDDIPF